MNYRYFANPYKFAFGLGTAVVCAVLAGAMLYIGEFISALVFGIIALVFFFPVFVYGSLVEVGDEGVACTFLGLVRRRMPWAEIAEVGILGTKMFNKSHPERTGEMYIYFSPKALTEEERFDLGMRWPPKNLIFLLYTKERTDRVQLKWSGRLHTYNTGNLHIE